MRLAREFAPTLDAVSTVGAELSALLERQFAEIGFRVGVELAAVELLSNIVRHGAPRGAIRLRARFTASAVSIAVADDGPPYDMSAPQDTSPADPLAEHGRGLWLIRKTVDRFCYRRLHGLNVHRISKRLTAPR